VQLGQNPAAALASAAAGSTVCLASGSWSQITLPSNLTQGVTLASATPGGAVVHGITSQANLSNLTVEGLDMTEGVQLHGALTNDTFKDLTMENWGSGSGDAQVDSAFWIYPYSGAVSGLAIEYVQMDHVPQCLQLSNPGANSNMANITFSHNVCGPGIGNGGETDVHYTQEEGLSGITMDNNAFIGPVDASAVANGSHVNVAHICGSNIEFNNNIVWHSDAVGQTFLAGDDCALSNLSASNNLFVEDPSASATSTFSLWAQDGSGVTFDNDTVVNAYQYGGEYVENVSNFQAHNNLAANDGGGAYTYTGCNTCSSNASDDSSGNLRWTPTWQSTTWTPNSGSPWNAPPAGYYQPTGIASTYGYQGSIGP
jgi:hypothetical protein